MSFVYAFSWQLGEPGEQRAQMVQNRLDFFVLFAFLAVKALFTQPFLGW
jgi:hypothetical protein